MRGELRGLWALLIALVVLGRSAPAEEIAWLHDADAAWQRTVDEQRLLLLFVTRPNCKYCSQMKSVTFTDQNVSELVEAAFVPLAIDPASDPELIKELKIAAYPTTLIISPEAGLLDRFKGYLPPAEFQRRLNRSRVQTTAERPHSSRR